MGTMQGILCLATGTYSKCHKGGAVKSNAMANAIKPLSNCLPWALDENIVETPPNSGQELLKWAITAVNNPLLVLSTVFFSV